MVKIRLMRIGTNKRPFYRVVVVDERRKRTGAYLELLGTYNPLTTPHEIKLNQPRIDDWVKKGAILSNGFLRMIGKAPKRLPRKPKKEKESPVISTAPLAEVSKPEESTPVEQPVESSAEVPKQEEPVVEQEQKPEKVETPPGKEESK